MTLSCDRDNYLLGNVMRVMQHRETAKSFLTFSASRLPHKNWKMTQGKIELNLNLLFALFCLNLLSFSSYCLISTLMPSNRYIFPIVLGGRFALKEPSLPQLKIESRVNYLIYTLVFVTEETIFRVFFFCLFVF